MSATYAAVCSVMLPNATQLVDAFHAVSLANRSKPFDIGSKPSSSGIEAAETIRSIGRACPAQWRRKTRNRRGQRLASLSDRWELA